MRIDDRVRPRRAVASLVLALLVSCTFPAALHADMLDDLTSPFKRLFRSTPPKLPPVPVDTSIDCPKVDIIYGAAAMRVYAPGASADSGALRHQISIIDVASECTATPDGGIVAKIGLAGRALLGPVGSAGTVTAPVTLLVKRGETVVARRVRTVSVAIPPSGQQGAFTFVEEGIAIPPGDGELTFEAGVGGLPGGPAEEKQQGKRKRR
jgi:hypothetical protein